MARQPKQIHVFLYRQKQNKYEYAIFQRADMPFCWQGIFQAVQLEKQHQGG
ncbi:MAG: hypothetical protein GX640_02790 [Fibrobacter sp.]|nr:hypothetical protein [Fibrobacter sp.]